MTTAVVNTDGIALAQARGGLYVLLANAWRYPDQDVVSALLNTSDRFVGSSAFRKLDDATACALDGVVDGIQALDREKRSPPDHIRDRYITLFGHAVRGTCPLYELEYGQSEIIQQASELADIAGFYSAFGLESAGAGADRPDHLAVECEFLSVLCAKEAAGLEVDLPALAETSFDAQRAFLRDHLAQWLPAFCARVMSADGDGLYGRLARLAAALVEAECRCFEIAAGPQYLELRTVDPNADANINCDGSAGEDRLVPLTMNGSEVVGA
jgi:DMSO reductase family type II enzyme chaperone